MNTVSKQTFRRSLLASACVIAMAGATHAEPYGQPTADYRLWAGTGADASLRGYLLAVTVPQQNFAPVTAEAQSIFKTLQLAGTDGSVATLGGNHIGAAAGANRNTTSIDLGLLQAATEGQAGIGAIVSQVQGSGSMVTRTLVAQGGVTAGVADARIGISAEGNAPQASVSANTVAAEAVLNRSATTLAGALPAAQGGWQPAGTTVAQSGWSSEASSTGLLNAGSFQAASSAYGHVGAATVVEASVGLSVAGSAMSPLAVDGNAVTARHGANDASTVIDVQSAAGGLQGSAVVTNAQSSLGDVGTGGVTPFPFFTANQVSSSANAAVHGASIAADVHGDSMVYVNTLDFGNGPSSLQAPLSVSGNLIQAEATGNSAGQRGATGLAAGNAVLVAGAAAVTGSGSGAMVRLEAEGTQANASVIADLAVLNSQLNRANAVGAEVLGAVIAASTGGIGGTGSVSLRDNALRAAATANLAGNLIDVQAGAFSASAAAANLQVNQDSSVRAGQQDVGVMVRAGDMNFGGVEGAVTLSGNSITAAADANVAVTSVSVQGTALRGAPGFLGDGGSTANTWDGAQAATGAAVSASNAQTHGGWYVDRVYGLDGGWGNDVTSAIEGAFVRADLGADGAYLAGAPVSLQGNAITAHAAANSASTGVALVGGDVAARAAVVNAQASFGQSAAIVDGAGIQAAAGGIASGALTVGGNRVAADASANQADNTLRAGFDRLDASTGSFYPVGRSLDGGMSVRAAQTIASEQRSSGSVDAQTGAAGGVTAIVGRSGAADSSIAVQGNQVAANARANVVNNAMALEGGAITRESYGYGYGYGDAVAGISNVQLADGMSRAAVGNHDGAMTIGAGIDGTVQRASVAVTGNTVGAASVGNTATNQLDVTATSLQSGGFGLLTLNAGEGGNIDFAIGNVQQDNAWSRSAEARGVRLAIDLAANQGSTVGRADNGYVGGSTLALSGNSVKAEARSNTATNGLALAGFGQLAASAVVLNAQDGTAQVGAVVDGARLRIHADDMAVDGSQLTLSGNRVQAIAVGASASNSLSAQADQLGGVSVAMPTFGVTSVPVQAASSYALQNMQSQQGEVTALADAAVRIRFAGSSMEQGTATVQGNRIEALAQATSASNTLQLAGNQVDAAGIVSSEQVTQASVVATLQSQGRNATAGIEAGSVYGTPLSVQGNGMLASAGQNEAFNSLAVNAVGANGSHAVLNSQAGSGFVSASAQPRFVGISVGSASGAPLTVSGNTVTAQASFNNAANSVALNASAGGSASATVRNDQVAGPGAASASVGGEEGLLIGVGEQRNTRAARGYGYDMVLNGAGATVSGNSVVADAAANNAANTLNVAAPQAVRYGYGTSYSVLNNQTNDASVSAAVTNTALGMSAGAMYGASGNVAGNQVQAQGTGNKASNVIGFGATTQAAQGQVTVQNVQFNQASISAAVRGVTLGAGAGYGGGNSSLAVQGNSISAQAIGNSAVNMLTIK